MDRAVSRYRHFNNEQRDVFDEVWDAVEQGRPLCMFVEGKAGTTTIINALCDALRASGRIVLPTATSAFAGQLYPGGRTTHSMFKV
ncbi:hypothetical protein CPB83DRAFT_772313 [Crepidotus variabilis]|uniref:ATP-dependent DNA helicase n=1 Tax=Crepidotus variabilis TaxID=179855 RepID=A0A9P6EA52_9AGAR|nr:hypothetical protein CPB83DRAFT_772313 [Crepidotus variabilis]